MVFKCDVCNSQADELIECCGQLMVEIQDDDETSEYLDMMGIEEDDDY